MSVDTDQQSINFALAAVPPTHNTNCSRNIPTQPHNAHVIPTPDRISDAYVVS